MSSWVLALLVAAVILGLTDISLTKATRLMLAITTLVVCATLVRMGAA